MTDLETKHQILTNAIDDCNLELLNDLLQNNTVFCECHNEVVFELESNHDSEISASNDEGVIDEDVDLVNDLTWSLVVEIYI